MIETVSRVVLFCAALALLGGAHAQVSDAERQALIDFYHATGGDEWERNLRWLGSAGSECEWYGITCVGPSDGTRRVLRIILPDNGLSGHLPSSLSGLEHLTALILPYNQLMGTVPGNLWQLDQLEVLNLAHNRFIGRIPGSVLDHPMEYLDLSGNGMNSYGSVSGNPHWPEDPRRINLADNELPALPPTEWREAGRFGQLDLSRNYLGAELNLESTEWAELEILILSGIGFHEISGLTPTTLPDLHVLDLSENQLDQWPLSGSAFPDLRTIDLSGNRLTELPESLTEQENLEVLELANNRLAGELPEWFGELSILELGLDNNDLEGPIERAISALDTESIEVFDNGPPIAMPRLRLHALDNRFSGSLPEDLDYRKFNSPYGISLSSEFGLDLCFNDIDPPGPQLLEALVPVHRGLDLAGCLERSRSTLALTVSGSWFHPERSGEGLTQMLLTDGQILSYWFTYYPRQASSTHPEGQMWMYDITPPEEQHIAQSAWQIPTGGRFGEGLSGGGPEWQTWRAETRQDALDTGGMHLVYELHHGGLCIAGGCYHAVASGRHDLTPLSRLAGTTCDNQQPNQWVSGAWYHPGSDGEGFVVEVIEDGRGVVYWFTYQPGESGQQAWMMGDGHFDGQTLTVDNLVQPVGTRFGQDFDTEEIEFTHWGSLVMEFDDDLNGHVWFDSVDEDFGAGDYPIERLARPMLAECD
jgi:hypothetical protein